LIEKEALEKKSMTPELGSWLDWVKKKVNWFDPMVEAEDDWLAGIDPNDLLIPDELKQSSTTNSKSHYNEDVPARKSGWPLLPWYLKK